MEIKVKRPRGRPRKRPRPEDELVAVDAKLESGMNKKRVVVIDTKPIVLVGRYVLKEFDGNGIYLGKIVHYDSGLYRVHYEDGDCEDLESSELRQFLLGENDLDDDLSRRRTKLDDWLLKKSMKNEKVGLEKKDGHLKSEMDPVEVSTLSGGLMVQDDGEQVEGDVDSSSDSCEHVQETDAGLEAEVPLIPPPELPASSGTIGVPEEYVSLLFSVYGFLRSFSIHLFLSPFRLDDFVGSLNYSASNTLLDAIHVALLRVLRRRLETLSLDGSELASNCLRCIDWNLLDTLTWSVYIVHYLTSMGHVKGPEWKKFYAEVLEGEYYSLSVGRKLMILQILCDDVLDTEELRSEIDLREELEFGMDPDAASSDASESGPRRVHPRYFFPKASSFKDREGVEIIAENDVTKSSSKAKPLGFKGSEREIDAPGVDVDGNGDECRICGMDGTLLCCDGCPSSYHSRCIGVAKMYIPEGPWYCLECTINKMGPTITTGTSLKGADLFGIDLYGQVFLGTCNHLLVLSASNNTEPCMRYYNPLDIPKVLRALLSSVQHVSLYSGVCKAILLYWGIPESAVSPVGIIEMCTNALNIKADEKFCSLSIHPPVKESHRFQESHRFTEMAEGENASSNNEINVDNVAFSSLYTSMDTMTRTDLPIAESKAITTTEKSHDCLLLNSKIPGQIKKEYTVSTGSVSQQADRSDVTYQSLVDRSSAIDLTTCTSISNDCFSGHSSLCLSANMSFQSKEGNHDGLLRVRSNSADKCVFMGSLFKPQAYINQYLHGEFAATAAAKLAVLSSEESQVLEAHKSGNSKNVMSGSIPLQAKAFSSTASRFFWPCFEKKIWEVPRERCSWCYSCKAPPSSRRGCMLNSAITVATKSAMKILNGLHPPKIGEGNLPTIATYMLYMEESLCGLIGGPFVSASYRKNWRKQVEDASTFNSIKALLLELEENIYHIALSGDWVKLMGDCGGDSSMIQIATSNVLTTQKRGSSGKRGRKHSGMSEVAADDCSDQSFSWWQGRKSTKLIFEKAVLPHKMVRNAARQGGVRKLSGVNYTDGSEVPKRSRQLVWRAAVERSKTASQLALQVRYVDLHIRWSELARPEQNVQDGKGPETEASAFRNAIICDKKIVENKIRYGVVFGNQKHLPSRVMKNIIDIELGQNRKEKYWFHEMRIPLYLIKEYEESVDKVIVPSSKKHTNELSEFQKKQLRASRKDLFSYLVCKRDRMEKCACASCQLDVLVGDAVKCSACQGFCHGRCTSTSMYMNVEVEPLIVCNQCYHAKALAPSEISSESPTSPLPLHRQEYHTAVKIAKGTRPKVFNQPLASVRTQESCSEIKQIASDSSLVTKMRSKTLSWGIIWKKKNCEDAGDDFRRANILLRGSSDIHRLKPVCDLCQLPYNSDLMYIHCETCERWFHAEAVELEESKLSDVVGFKCCKCRRIGGPECPYMDPELKEQKRKKRRLRAQKQGQGSIRVDSDHGTISESQEFKPTTPVHLVEKMFVPEDDPLLFSLSKVELITEPNSEVDCEWNTSAPGLQKLPVRRQVKCEGDVGGGSVGNNLPNVDLSMSFEINNVMNDPKEELSGPCVDWDASNNGLEGEILFDYDGLNYEDMEFEPQTYFSFSELLASDDGVQLDGIDASGVVSGNQEDLSYSVALDGAPQQCGMGTSNDRQEYTISAVNNMNNMHCHMCSDMERAPDLSCEVCGFLIHSRCSPWDESPYTEGSWKCGNCREWR